MNIQLHILKLMTIPVCIPFNSIQFPCIPHQYLVGVVSILNIPVWKVWRCISLWSDFISILINDVDHFCIYWQVYVFFEIMSVFLLVTEKMINMWELDFQWLTLLRGINICTDNIIHQVYSSLLTYFYYFRPRQLIKKATHLSLLCLPISWRESSNCGQFHAVCVWLLLNQRCSKLNAEMPRFAGGNFLSQDSHMRTQTDKFQNHHLLGGEVLVICRGSRGSLLLGVGTSNQRKGELTGMCITCSFTDACL